MGLAFPSVDKRQEGKRAQRRPSDACEIDQAGRYRVFPKNAGFMQILLNQ